MPYLMALTRNGRKAVNNAVALRYALYVYQAQLVSTPNGH
jgi:hypothetical protein